MTKEIEVIDQYNARHRFPAEEHYYEWRLKPGTIDEELTSNLLDVASVNDSYEIAKTKLRRLIEWHKNDL